MGCSSWLQSNVFGLVCLNKWIFFWFSSAVNSIVSSFWVYSFRMSFQVAGFNNRGSARLWMEKTGRFGGLLQVSGVYFSNPFFDTSQDICAVNSHINCLPHLCCREYLPFFFQNKQFAREKDSRTPLQLLSQLIADIGQYASSRYVPHYIMAL